jgi:hypothetical protein
MNIRVYEKSDYPVIRDWWVAHGWDAVPEAILPKTGAIVSNNGIDVVVAWLYMDNSVGVSWIEWFVSNPVCNGFQVIKAHKLLVSFLERCATDNDYGVMLTSCKQPIQM